nr:immunoglobulin heavy chain junction region [Macaca mulatta]MOY25393.1 immunoglobulin heavy chain junction region [Macaca mulatta]MOY26425.1 immunoglobulin heavy chain junction region [Macaca mulatta]MOY29200.1 immunoglobulin heavy chain junction region [Macaca mulatta]MOY29889.1 immunoglobulin heavy chain junction region [Macaca mulatta]
CARAGYSLFDYW